MTAAVVISDYDPDWPRRYDEEQRRIRQAMGPVLVGTEHIGSTAVPGLGAKPIVDIMAAVEHLDDVMSRIGDLAEIGYEYAPEFEALIPERRFFRKGPAHSRDFHLHVVEWDGEFWRRHLLFRDYLRAHPEVAHDYERLKRELAVVYAADRPGYTEAKGPFIREVEAAARREKAAHDGTS